jgi:hypothetical protein
MPSISGPSIGTMAKAVDSSPLGLSENTRRLADPPAITGRAKSGLFSCELVN